MRASDIPLGALLKVPLKTGFITMTLVMRDVREVPPGYVILWDECSYGYWVKADADVDILRLPTPEQTKALEALDRADQERVSDIPELNER